MNDCKKRYFSIIALCILTLTVFAQEAIQTNSPYSRYGFGTLTDQSGSNSKAMGGIGYALRNGFHVNPANPASYSAVDSLTFIFDLGMTLQNANFTENNIKTNAKNSTLDHVAMQFRLWKRMGMTVGFVPYSYVGYSFQTSHSLKDKTSDATVDTYSTYAGNGGLQQILVGFGYRMFDNLSIGVNGAYLYGDINHVNQTMFSNANAYRSVRRNEISVNDYKLDFGLQYTLKVNKNDKVTLGAVYGLGHEMNSKGRRFDEIWSTSSSVLTSSGDSIKNGFELPQTIGVGLTYVHNEKLTIGVDFTLQKWANTKFFGEEGKMTDRKKLSIGMEYVPDRLGRGYLKRINYRAGAFYSEPYTKIDGRDGAKEYGVSAGIGLPLHLYYCKSYLSISGQYVHVAPKVSGMLKENYLRINIGMTFNEPWFMKRRVN